MLFAESGEDKVRIWDRQEIALGLAAAFGALTPDAAGTDRDEGLANLISAAAGVVVGRHEAGEALLLIRLQHLVPGGHDGKTGSEAENCGLAEFDSAEEKADQQDGRVG